MHGLYYMCVCVCVGIWACMCLTFLFVSARLCVQMCFHMCVFPLVYVCPTQMERPPLPLAPRLWGDTHCSLCQAQMSIHSSTPLSLNPAQGSFAYWGRVCIFVCVCMCVCVWVCTSLPPLPRNRTGGPVDSMHMHCYYSIGDSAGLVDAKLIQLCACMHSGLTWTDVWYLLAFVVCTLCKCSKLSFSLDGLILHVWRRHRDSIKHIIRTWLSSPTCHA